MPESTTTPGIANGSPRLQSTTYDGIERKRRRGCFRYRGREYNLSITDPAIAERYEELVPDPGKAPLEFPLPCGDDLLICLSLAREFQDYHYKVVATVFEGFAVTEATQEARLFTVGHSNHSLETFLSLLQQHQITAVADLRSVPFSRYVPHFNREALARSLERASIRYVDLAAEFGARRTEPECYDEGRVKYDLVAKSPLFLRGLDRIQKGIESFRIAMMCAEKDPITCHRSILVCRHLKGQVDPIVHILDDGRLEPHADAESRLLKLFDLDAPNLFLSRDELLEQAYQSQSDKLAYVSATGEEEPLP